MNRGLPIILICLFILVNPLDSDITTTDDTALNGNVLAAAQVVRVYGTDYSQQVFDNIDLNSFRNFIIGLTELGSRPVGSPLNFGMNNLAAREWIIDRLKSVSNNRIEVEVLGEYASVVGKLPGYLPVDAPALMVGGHYDTIANSPGANDDATGVAAALEIARVMSKYNWPLDIYFGAWNAEEIGLLGSTEVANIMKGRGVSLLAYYNVDMLFVPDPSAPSGSEVLMAYPGGNYHKGAYWADLTRMMSRNYGEHMIQPVASVEFSGWENSDHWPFVQQGYTALCAHESGFEYDTPFHTPQDTWNNPLYDYEVAIETVKAIGGAMAFTMARAYGKRTVHEYSFTLITSHEKNYMLAISTPTVINVTSRWFGGGTSVSLYNKNNQLLVQVIDTDASPWGYTQIINQSVATKGIYRLNVANYYGSSVGHELRIEYETDTNGNGILDRNEFWFDQEFFSMDSDFDTISDGQEMIIGTLRNSNDSDSDSLPDPWEIEYGLDPLDPGDASEDNDSDGVSNQLEYVNQCNPNNSDSDLDTMPDLWEIENGLDPTTDDSLEDPDNDAVVNVREFEDGTNPQYAEFRPDRLLLPSIIVVSVAAILTVLYKRLNQMK